jgi:hypothetical protein
MARPVCDSIWCQNAVREIIFLVLCTMHKVAWFNCLPPLIPHPFFITSPFPSLHSIHAITPSGTSQTLSVNAPHVTHLANRPMNTFTHRSLPSPALRLASWVDVRTRMLFLGAGIFALAQDREVGFIVVLVLVSLVHSSPSTLQQSPCTLYTHQRI